MSKGRYKGLVSYDGMFSLIPILLLTVFLLNSMQYMLYNSIEKVKEQEKFNMLVVIADYVVKNAGAYTESDGIYPNLMDQSKLSSNILGQQLGGEYKMTDLFIGLESESSIPNDERTCIYRIVAKHPNREVDKLFVCG